MVVVVCALMRANGAVLVWESEMSCNLFLILLVEVALDWWKVNCLGLAPPCSERGSGGSPCPAPSPGLPPRTFPPPWPPACLDVSRQVL